MKALFCGNDYDYFHVNSLFILNFALMPLRQLKKANLISKTVLAPRSMLKAGGLSMKSMKKQVFFKTAQLVKLYDGITWHVTNEQERNEILK